ncbi:MAG: phosphate acetyltransferase [Calditrichaeota bacterium]|nr:phosphate acetyltransferase [Calditrichota bacterium]
MKSLYVSSTEPRSGKSAVALGLMKLLQERVDKVSYIKPIGRGGKPGEDEDVELVRRLFLPDVKSEFINPVGIEEARRLLAAGSNDELLTRILRASNRLSAECDVMVVEGTDYSGAISALEFDINADISKTLDAPVLMVAKGRHRSAEEIVGLVTAAKESFDERGCDFIGVIVTKVEPALHPRLTAALEKGFENANVDLLGVVPYDLLLGMPRMGEIARKIGAKVLYGHNYLENLAASPRVAAMTIGNVLERLQENMLLITPGDRDDMLLALMVSRISSNCPNIAGICLSGGFEPSPSVKKLIGGLSGLINIPVLSVPYDTYETAVKCDQMEVSLYAGDYQKIEALYRDTLRWVKKDKIDSLLKLERAPKTTPIVFLNGLMERARSQRKRIVMPEGDEERTLKAVRRIIDDNIADIILLGDEKTIRDTANRIGAKIESALIINPATSDKLEEYTDVYFKLRSHKGITVDNARDTMLDPIYYGTMMVHLGDADGLVSGAVHTTRHTITPAFQFIKTRPGISLVSSVFFMCLEDRVLVYGDCAVNPNPNAEELADIAISSAETAASFGFKPLVAMLSYSTGTSGIGPEVERVAKATEIVRQKAPDLEVEGPIQYDAAVSIETARTKLPESHVAGRANVFIFPDLNAGNTAYKAVQRSAKAIAVGPALQGLNKPVNDLSRGCLVEDIVYTIAITAIQAQAVK